MSIEMMRRRKTILTGIFVAVVVYVALYLVTTTFRQTGGQGGLSGAPTARQFAGIGHLLVFYPCYLAERWTREAVSLVSGGLGHPFDVELKNGNYVMSFLYGDDKYSSFWLSWVPAVAAIGVPVTAIFVMSLRLRNRKRRKSQPKPEGDGKPAP